MEEQHENEIVPWEMLHFPPKNMGTSSHLGYLYMLLSRTTMVWENESVLAEQQIAEWWEKMTHEEATKHGRDVKDTFAWGGMVIYRLPDSRQEAEEELKRTNDMKRWLRITGRHDAILFYQLVAGLITDAQGVAKMIMIWGLVEKQFIEKAVMKGADEEIIGSFITVSPFPLHPYSVHADHRYVQYGKDRWLYPQIDCNPADYGTQEGMDKSIMDNREQYDATLTTYASVIAQLMVLERKRSQSARDKTEYLVGFRRIVREQYLATIDLSNPEVRLIDFRMRRLFFFYILATEDPEERQRLVNVGAMFIQTMIEIGWPAENHIAYFAIRTQRDNDRILVAPYLAASASDPVSTPRHSVDLGRRSSIPTLNVEIVPALVMLPGDTVEFLKNRFRTSVAMITKHKVPFFFDSDDDMEETTTTIVDQALIITRRLKDDLESSIIVESHGKKPSDISWKLLDQPIECEFYFQVVFDPFPTRFYVVFGLEALEDAKNNGFFGKELDIRLEKIARDRVREAFSHNERLKNAWSSRPGSKEGKAWMEQVHFLITDEYRIAVFPYIVLPSLEDLRRISPHEEKEFYSNGFSFGFRLSPTDVPDLMFIQPSMRQLITTLMLSSFVPVNDHDSMEIENQPAAAAVDEAQIIESKDMFSERTTREAIEATLERFEKSYDAKPTRVWVRKEAAFAANPPDELPEVYNIVPIVAAGDEILAKNNRKSCEGRIITYKEYGYWLASEFRLAFFCARTRIEEVFAGDAARYLQQTYKIDASTFASLNAKFSSKAHLFRYPSSKRKANTSANIVIVSSSNAIVPTNGIGAANAIKMRSHREDSLARDLKEREIDAEYSKARSTMKPFPGTREQRKSWIDFADSKGEELKDFLWNRDPITDPKKSIGITSITNQRTGAPYFLFTDRKRSFGGGGSYQLIIYNVYTEIFEGNIASIQAAKDERKAWEVENKDKDHRDGPISWTKKAAQEIDDKFYEQYKAEIKNKKNGVTTHYLHTANELIYEKAKLFYDLHHPSSASLNGILSPPHPLPLIVPKQPHSEVRKAQLKHERDSVMQLYDSSVPIDKTLAQLYLRKHRGLNDLCEEVLERSPYVRFHSSLIYSIQAPKGSSVAAKSVKKNLPALLCFCSSSEDSEKMVAVQRIFLDPKNPTKVTFHDQGKVNPAKKSKGQLKEENAFFMVQPGRLEVAPVVFLAEGPETAWSVAAASSYLCVYASFGVQNFSRFSAHMGHKSRPDLCLVLDRDKDPKTRAAIEKLIMNQAQILKKAGWTVVAKQPDCDDHCKDFNEMHQKHGITRVRECLRIPEEGRFSHVLHDDEGPSREWKRYLLDKK